MATDRPFWRADRGSRTRIGRLIDALTRRAEVTVSFVGKADPADYARARMGPAAVDFFDAHIPRWQQSLVDFACPAYQRHFIQLCQRMRPDIVLIEYIKLAFLLDGFNILEDRKPRTWIDTLDVTHERTHAFEARGLRHGVATHQQEERDALARFDRVLAINTADAAQFRALIPSRKVVVVGHTSPIRVHPFRQSQTMTIGLIGSNSLPNQDGLNGFLRDAWPGLYASCGTGVRLYFGGGVGKSVPANAPGVEVAGHVEDLSQFYAACDVIINPNQFGSGLAIKSVEALVNGKPLVSGPVGVRGLPAGVEKAVCMAPTLRALSEKLSTLVARPALRRSRSLNPADANQYAPA